VLIFLFPRRTPFPPPRATARSRPPLSRHYRGRMEKRKAKKRGSASVAAIPERNKYFTVAEFRENGSRASRLASRGISDGRLGDAV